MSRLQDRRNAKRVNGLRRDPRTGAGKLAKAERGYGGVLALDFTDNSVALYDPTTQANIAYSQGVTDGNGNFRGPHALLTYTSPSNKITLQSDGFLRYQAHNLCTYSEDLTTSWSGVTFTVTANNTTAPDGTTTADLIQMNATSGGFVNQLTTVVGGTYTLTFRVKQSAAGHLRIIFSNNAVSEYFGGWFNLSTGAWGTTDSATASLVSASSEADTNGFYKVSITGTATDTTSKIYFYFTAADNSSTRSTTPAAWLWGFHVYRYPANTDYIKTTSAAKYALPREYDTSGNCLGLLVEEARTNLCLHSNDLTQSGSWTASNMTTAKTATGPDNVANSATTITATAGNATILQAITSTSAARVTSVYIKRRTGTGNIDLTQDNGSTWTTQAVDSTWTRFSLSSVTSANPTVGIRIVTSGDAVDVALFSHEVGAFVTSPIITYGAAATRAVDNISIATSAFPHSATATTMYLSCIPFVEGTGDVWIEKSAATRSNSLMQFYSPNSSTGAAMVERGVGFSVQATVVETSAPVDGSSIVRMGMSAQTNLFDFSINGSIETQDTSGTHQQTTHTNVQFGSGTGTVDPGKVIIMKVLLLPRTSTAAELITRTT